MSMDAPVKWPGKLVAGADLSAAKYHFVKFNTVANTVVLCDTLGEMPDGVLYNAPTSGQAAEVAALVPGSIVKVEGSGVTAVGDRLGTSAAGEGVTITDPDHSEVGHVNEVGADGDYLEIRVAPRAGGRSLTPGGGAQTIVVPVPGHLAADATGIVGLWSAPVAGDVESVKVHAGVAVTGANTNTTHLNLLNAGTAGIGTTEIGNYDLTSGNDLTLMTGQEVLGVAGAGTDATLAAGEILALQFEKVGTGLLVPASCVVITFNPA